MLSSMTGFGRAVHETASGRLIVEIQSVNRKFLEVFVALPKEFSRFEHEVRKWVTEVVSRGQVNVRVFYVPGPSAVQKLLPDPESLSALKKAWEKIAKSAGFNPKSIDLAFILQHSPLQPKVDQASDTDLKILRACVDEALQALVKMKRKEGKALKEDLLKRIGLMEKSLSEIETLSKSAVKKMRDKLSERIKEVMQQDADERILKEVALFAEKVDISEEITRLKSHFAQSLETLRGAEPVGRKMEFLIQEMGREINTIGSKTPESKVSYLVVEMKSELEKMREQIQNIE
jgi:uncharacterized protein (TIGR00255 family)